MAFDNTMRECAYGGSMYSRLAWQAQFSHRVVDGGDRVRCECGKVVKINYGFNRQYRQIPRHYDPSLDEHGIPRRNRQ